MDIIDRILAAREAVRTGDLSKVEEFLNIFADYVFVCRKNNASSRDELSNFYIAKPRDVLGSEDEVLEVLRKENCWTSGLLRETQDERLVQEVKNIIINHFSEEYFELIDYYSPRLHGQFLNVSDPTLGIYVKIRTNEVIVEVDALVKYYTELAVRTYVYVLKRQDGRWVVTRSPLI